jgi:hypothetical protein
MTTREQDLRLGILNTLLTTPHRQLDDVWLVHADLVRQDPRFYVRLAAWYADHGDVRDHQEVFIITLVLSDFPGHRDVGLALLRALPPYQVVRVVDFISGRTQRARGGDGAALARHGLFRSVPRCVRTEVARYLREREADADWFDSSVLVARKAVKRLYALLHVAPSPRAQQVLFDDRPPPGSRLFALRRLARATSPEEQARAVVEHAIPYRVAASVVRNLTPVVLAALVERMSAQEVINNLAALERRGALAEPALKALVERKLDEARGARRVSALKAEEAAKVARLSPDVRGRLEKVADTQVKAKGRITRPAALLIDKSGSMSSAIELGKRIGALLSAVCERELYVYAFDTLAYEVEAGGSDLAAWERSLVGITAGGGTSVGVAVEALRRKRQYVEQLIVITDEGENTPPLFVDGLRKYREELKAEPAVCFVRTPGATTQLEEACRRAGLVVDAFQFAGDYYALPNLVPLLARPSKLELLLEILDYPLPARKPA